MTSRRAFLRHSAMATAAAIPTKRLGMLRLTNPACSTGRVLMPPPMARTRRPLEPDLHALAKRALDAASSAGARYADVRIIVTRIRSFSGTLDGGDAYLDPPSELESIEMGVRALTGGAWGFIGTTDLTPETVSWMGQTASALAKTATWTKVPPVELDANAPVATGHWTMPVARDPFTASYPGAFSTRRG